MTGGGGDDDAAIPSGTVLEVGLRIIFVNLAALVVVAALTSKSSLVRRPSLIRRINGHHRMELARTQLNYKQVLLY